MIHLHGTGRPKKKGSPWPGLLALGVMVGIAIASIVEVGWLAIAPFGFAGLILLALLWLMRATDRAHQ